MTDENLQTLRTFGLDTIPTLDVAVLGALERFEAEPVPTLPLDVFRRPLVVGSAGAAATGRLLYAGVPEARFADADSFPSALAAYGEDIDGAVLISASGGKDARDQAAALARGGVPAVLITNNPAAPAAQHLDAAHVHVLPKNREPYTYNTSTYLGMLLAAGGEDPAAIHRHLTEVLAPAIPRDLAACDAYFVVLPQEFAEIAPFIRIKFDELFGARVSVRVFTPREALHAKTVVPSDTECFVSIGDVPSGSGSVFDGGSGPRVPVALPAGAGAAGAMAACYYLIGRIQAQHPPYFAEHLVAYTKRASAQFGEEIPPIVA